MFERYNEAARRVIFFARYEASKFGSHHIESEHILLGLLRQEHSLLARFPSLGSYDELRAEIERVVPKDKPISTSVDLPLTNECKRVLSHAADEALELGSKHIGAEHLLLGLLGEPRSLASEILKKRGLQIEELRESFRAQPHTPGIWASAVRLGKEWIGPREVILMDGNEEVGHLTPAFGFNVPQIGEAVVLPAENGDLVYRVKDVVWQYEVAPGQESEGHHSSQRLRKLVKVVINLERKQ
jgi:hypothetical protein